MELVVTPGSRRTSFTGLSHTMHMHTIQTQKTQDLCNGHRLLINSLTHTHIYMHKHTEEKDSLGSEAHAQRGLPEGKLLSGRRAQRWIKSEPNPLRALNIHLPNGPVKIHNRF